uniref:RNA-binding protein AKIP1 n=1 Tax=Solanum tuberosum TaxID=4113 RepID=M1A7C8_SOLTU
MVVLVAAQVVLLGEWCPAYCSSTSRLANLHLQSIREAVATRRTSDEQRLTMMKRSH